MSQLFTKSNRIKTALAITAVGAAFYSLPMITHLLSSAPTIDSSKPLKPEAIRRGAFNNSGSKDIGPDPGWVNGVYSPKRKKSSEEKT